MKLSELIQERDGYEFIQCPLADGGHINITLAEDGRLTVCVVPTHSRELGEVLAAGYDFQGTLID